MGSFIIGEVGEYIPQNVEPNEFLNTRLESDKYGIYYSVKFEGDAETFLLQAKKAPVEGQPEWGMIEQSKSGKSMRFKRVKRDDAPRPTAAGESKSFLKDVSDIPVRFMQSLLQYYDVQKLSTDSTQYENYLTLVKMLSDDALLLIENVRKDGDTPRVAKQTPATESIKGGQGTSLGDQFRNRNEPELTDDDIPPEFL